MNVNTRITDYYYLFFLVEYGSDAKQLRGTKMKLAGNRLIIINFDDFVLIMATS